MDSDADHQEQTDKIEYDDMVEYLNRIRSRAVTFGYMVLRDFQLSELVYKEASLLAARKYTQFTEDVFEPWFWGLLTEVLEKYAAQQDRKSLFFDRENLLRLRGEYRKLPVPSRVSYKSMMGCIRRLDSEQAKVFCMRFYDGLSCEQMSEELDRSTKSVCNLISRCKRSIRKGMGEADSDELAKDMDRELADVYMAGTLDDEITTAFEKMVLKNESGAMEKFSNIAYNEMRFRRVALYLGKAGKLPSGDTALDAVAEDILGPSTDFGPKTGPRTRPSGSAAKSERASSSRARGAAYASRKSKNNSMLILLIVGGVLLLLVAVIVSIIVTGDDTGLEAEKKKPIKKFVPNIPPPDGGDEGLMTGSSSFTPGSGGGGAETAVKSAGAGAVPVAAPPAAKPVLAKMTFNFGPGNLPGGVKLPGGTVNDSGGIYDAALGRGWVGPAVSAGAVGSSSRKPVCRAMLHELQSDPMTKTSLMVGSSSRKETWKVAAANGKYNITICVGSVSADAGPHYIELEGQKLVDMQPTTKGQHFRGSLQIEVADGELTMDVGGVAGCGTTYINYLIIDPV